jgi:dihydroneopterin aldolase
VDRIVIRGLRELAVVGVLPEEQVRPQPLEIDVELSVDLRPAGESDDLADTVDYGAVAEQIRRVVSGERHQLLERLAERLAMICRDDPRVTACVVEVRKLRPPIGAIADYTAVRIER